MQSRMPTVGDMLFTASDGPKPINGLQYKMNKLWPLVILIAIWNITAASATDSICEAVAITNTSTHDDFPYPLRRGQRVTAITQYNVNKKTGIASFCSHGGGCYPAQALRLTNCVIKWANVDSDGEENTYGLDIIRSKVPTAILRQNDIELQLLRMGLCSACADNAAAYYVKMPASRCAQLVRQSLEGDPVAIQKLRNVPDYCVE